LGHRPARTTKISAATRTGDLTVLSLRTHTDKGVATNGFGETIKCKRSCNVVDLNWLVAFAAFYTIPAEVNYRLGTEIPNTVGNRIELAQVSTNDVQLGHFGGYSPRVATGTKQYRDLFALLNKCSSYSRPYKAGSTRNQYSGHGISSGPL
jgi:hypothetical protein